MAATLRTQRLLVAAAALLAAGLVGGLVAGVFGSNSHPSNAATVYPLGGAQQSQLEQGVTAPTVSAQAVVVAPQVRTQFLGKGQRRRVHTGRPSRPPLPPTLICGDGRAHASRLASPPSPT
jgi:hypothetical protein